MLGGDPVTCPALQFEYHGPHATAAQDHADPVDWEPSVKRTDRIRVREHTCTCRSPIFELCTAGGLSFVRRLTDDDTATVESSRVSARVARDLWERILNGQAR